MSKSQNSSFLNPYWLIWNGIRNLRIFYMINYIPEFLPYLIFYCILQCEVKCSSTRQIPSSKVTFFRLNQIVNRQGIYHCCQKTKATNSKTKLTSINGLWVWFLAIVLNIGTRYVWGNAVSIIRVHVDILLQIYGAISFTDTILLEICLKSSGIKSICWAFINSRIESNIRWNVTIGEVKLRVKVQIIS